MGLSFAQYQGDAPFEASASSTLSVGANTGTAIEMAQNAEIVTALISGDGLSSGDQIKAQHLNSAESITINQTVYTEPGTTSTDEAPAFANRDIWDAKKGDKIRIKVDNAQAAEKSHTITVRAKG